MRKWIKKHGLGVMVCTLIAFVSQWLGTLFPLVGGAVFALLIGMAFVPFTKNSEHLNAGLTFTSKKILQSAVVLLGFGLNLGVVWETGKQSLPIVLSTITVALVIAYIGHRYGGIEADIATLVGVGSSICGGSAIAATAPVIDAKEEDVAQAISVIFFFNLLAALLFPNLGQFLGFSTQTGENFGLFAGTAINDTSSVTAAAATWDNLHHLGSQTLDTAVTVKLTRTLAIMPITAALSFLQTRKTAGQDTSFAVKSFFPTFILFFILASLFTTTWTSLGLSGQFFLPIKNLSKFFITMAMSSIGLRTNLIHLIQRGKRALVLGAICWGGITIVSLLLQYLMGLIH